MLTDPVLQYSLLGAFSLLFAFAVMAKWQDKAAFEVQLGAYQLIPSVLILPASRLVMLAEVMAATLLVTKGHVTGTIIALSLLGIYAIAIGINLQRGRSHIDCGCLGHAGQGISYSLVLRNLFLMLLLSLTLLPVAPRSLIWLDYMSIGLAVMAATLVYAAVTTLIANGIQARLWWG